MARQVLAWRCRYCGSLKNTEAICERHEMACTANPDRKNCMDCVHSIYPYGESVLTCDKRHIQCTKAVSAKCPYYDKRKEL